MWTTNNRYYSISVSVNRNQALDCYLFTIMRFWQTPRLLGHVDTELPEFVFETSFKIVPSNPSSEVAPCFELEPVYEISWRHGWWYIDFDIVFINQRAKNLAENRLMWKNSYHPGLFCGTSYCVFEVFLIWGRGMSVSRLIWSAGLGAEAFRLLSKYYMCATITFGPAILGSELHLLQWHCTGQQAASQGSRHNVVRVSNVLSRVIHHRR